LVKDEGLHSRFGWMYLEWAAAELSDAEKARLASVAEHAIEAFAPVWRSAGRTQSEMRALGWVEGDAYRAVGERAAEEVASKLARFGICI
jgi:hypothetical protein